MKTSSIASKSLHQNSNYLFHSKAFRNRIYLFNKSAFIFDRRDNLNSNSINLENELFESYHRFNIKLVYFYLEILHLLATLFRILRCIICLYDHQLDTKSILYFFNALRIRSNREKTTKNSRKSIKNTKYRKSSFKERRSKSNWSS